MSRRHSSICCAPSPRSARFRSLLATVEEAEADRKAERGGISRAFLIWNSTRKKISTRPLRLPAPRASRKKKSMRRCRNWISSRVARKNWPSSKKITPKVPSSAGSRKCCAGRQRNCSARWSNSRRTMARAALNPVLNRVHNRVVRKEILPRLRRDNQVRGNRVQASPPRDNRAQEGNRARTIRAFSSLSTGYAKRPTTCAEQLLRSKVKPKRAAPPIV